MMRLASLRDRVASLAMRPVRRVLAAPPLIAAGIAALLLVGAIVTVSLGTQSSHPAPPGNGLPPGLPKVLCDPDCNTGIRTGPEQVNEVDLQVNPTDPNNIVAAANDYAQPSGAHWVGAYWSKDGGKSWGAKLLPGYAGSRQVSVLSGMGASGDPAIAFDTNGNVYLAGIAYAVSPIPGPNPGRSSIVFVAKSGDGGETYSQITAVTTAFTSATFNDKEWIAVDPTNNYVYVTWVRFNGPVAQMLLSRSTDGGLLWSPRPTVISNATSGEFQIQGVYPMVTSDGILHITYADFQQHVIMHLVSTDHGSTFTKPVGTTTFVDLPNPLPNAKFRSALLPQGAVDNGYSEYQGSIYVAWNDYRNNDSDIYLTYSRDGGNSWSNASRVNTNPLKDGTDQFMPDIAVTVQGYVIMEWYDRRDDPNNTLIRPYFAISTNGGATFTDMGVGPPFNGDNGGTSLLSGENHLIGDYVGVSTTSTTAFMAWADTRNGSPSAKDSDIYGARVQFA